MVLSSTTTRLNAPLRAAALVLLSCSMIPDTAYAFVTPGAITPSSVLLLRPTSTSASTRVSLKESTISADALGDVVEDLGGILSNAKEAIADSLESVASSSAPNVINDQLDNANELLSSLSQTEMGIAVGVVGLVALGAILSLGGGSGDASSGSSSTSSSSSSTKKEKPAKRVAFDVSIPYNAAARLAYAAWLEQQGVNSAVKDSDETFQKFEEMYIETTVAKVTAKQKARDLASFDPNKPKPQPRSIPVPQAAAPKAAAAPKVKAKAKDNATPFFATAKK